MRVVSVFSSNSQLEKTTGSFPKCKNYSFKTSYIYINVTRTCSGSK